ncbi:MAG: hypothetical protein IKO21_06550 [Fibrobacter sp.]|nr:hypothetical protein [Fibrobacter sp.]
MNKSFALNLLKVCIAVAVCFLAACDDEGPSQVSYVNAAIADTVKDLAKCNDAHEGDVAWVKGERSARVCVKGKWLSTEESTEDTVEVAGYKVYTQDKKVQCSAEELKDKSGIKIICYGDSVGFIPNGVDGVDGVAGKNGKKGSDGKDGTQGSDGKDGKGCYVEEAEEGVFRFVCDTDTATFYKSTCGTVAYNSLTHFCYSEKVFPKCGDFPYDVKEQICVNGLIRLKCEYMDYNRSRYICDARDGRLYRYVQIGTQYWLAENLDYVYKVYDEDVGDSVVYGNFCNEDDCDIYGRYYTWAAAVDSVAWYNEKGMECGFGKFCTELYSTQGICPDGWSLPRREDWALLLSKASVYDLQEKGYSKWSKATNKTGFSLLPAGVYVGDFGGSPYDFGYTSSLPADPPRYINRAGCTATGDRARLWTLDDRTEYAAWYYHINEAGGGPQNYYYGKDSGLSVRCVRYSSPYK